MRVEEIPAYEQNFHDTGIDSQGKRHILSHRQIPIPGETISMNYTLVQPASGKASYYYQQEFPKKQIVLHYTMGYLKGDIATLTAPDEYVSVPFVIARNGTIYNLFSSRFWSFHLGLGAIGGNEIRSKATIGIELSNIGHLTQTSEGMKSWRNVIYCDVSQIQFYEQRAFQGYRYFATFTAAQYQSLLILLRYLTAQYNIAREFLPDDFRYLAFDEVIDFNGIVSHVNYRSTGKLDIGPAFDWERIIAGMR